MDPGSFSILSVRLIGSQIPEALSAIDAAWSATTPATIHRRFLSQRLQEMYAHIELQGTGISLGAALVIAYLTALHHAMTVVRALPTAALRYE